jgi:diguanylate cyclase (GGDEF)-like protein
MESTPNHADNHLPRQRLRIRRWLMAASFYVIGVLLVLYGWQQGQMDAIPSILFVTMVVVGNAVVYWFLSSEHNSRLEDPSLTVPQMLLAIIATLIIIGGATASLRPTISLGLMAPLIFGCFQLQPRQLLRMALLVIGGYGVMLALLFLTKRLPQPVIELTHWVSLSLILGAFVAICSEIARMRDRQHELSAQLKESADRDPLTGLYNRRWLARHLPQAIELAQRHQRSYAVGMLDIDHFKQINDLYGHAIGDAALLWVADQIRSLLRKSDEMVRVGGEEFLLLLPETDLPGSHELAERICQQLASERFEFTGNPPLQITVSIGIAQLGPGDHADQLMDHADNGLYVAKQQGRNRVYVVGA